MSSEAPLLQIGLCESSARFAPAIEKAPLIRRHARVTRLSRWGLLPDLAATPVMQGIAFLDLAGVPPEFPVLPGGLAFARPPGLPASRPPGLPASRPPEWYVVGVCGGQALDPFTVYGLAKWGMDDLVQWGQAPTSREVDGIVLRAVTRGWRHRLEDALLESVAPDDRLAVQAVFRAAAGCLARGEWSVPAMARELFRSRSALERDMRELGLVTPGKFIRRLRLALVLLPWRVLGADALLARLWGFYSVGDLSNQVRRNFDVPIAWFGQAGERAALVHSASSLLEGLESTATNDRATTSGRRRGNRSS